ncbi:MAG: AEC family transporter [Candidatus Thermoplasmatota archaeon]
MKKIFHPVLIATIIALFIVLIGLRDFIPDLFVSIFDLLGAMTIPLLMIILGGNIYVDFKRQGEIKIFEISKFVLSKNIIFPLIFIGLLLILRSYLSYTISLIIVLQAAVPPVTAVPLVTERSGGNRTIVSQFMASSFLASLFTIPDMAYIFNIFFSAIK